MTKADIFEKLENRLGDDLNIRLKDLPSPFLMKDMTKAVNRIFFAIRNEEKIVIVGDYDVDGTTSSAMMIQFFNEINYPVNVIIPNRFTHGYGLSPAIVDIVEKHNADLVITVDNGISAIDAAKKCKDLNIDLIITDHHLLPPKKPEAFAIVNPHQEDCSFPYKHICGAQIVFFLISAIKIKMQNRKIDLYYYLQYAAVATVADMMPLRNINRAMVKYGLSYITDKTKKTPVALEYFAAARNLNVVTSLDIGFYLGPRINSIGRLDSAEYAVNFLISPNKITSQQWYRFLEETNKKRKEIENTIYQSALKQIESNDHFIVVYGEAWHEGVLGIVASKIGKNFNKPAIVLTKDSAGNAYKGSGRSYCDLDIYKIVLECEDILDKFGGHSSAVGLSIKEKNIDIFKKRINQTAAIRKYLKEKEDDPILGDIDFNDITPELPDEMEKRFGPFGQKNPAPVFVASKVKVISYSTMGEDDRHFRVSIEKDGVSLTGVMFDFDEPMIEGDYYNIEYTINKNEWRGNVSVQLLIQKIEAL